MNLASWLGFGRERAALTAATTIVQGPVVQGGPTPPAPGEPQRQVFRSPDVWQNELWDFYDTLGEFRQGVTWKANMLSRIRLRAAQVKLDQDEPEIVDAGPANDIIRELAGGIGGQAAVMSDFAVHLNVPGECYLIGETRPDGTNSWYVRSITEVRRSVVAPTGYALADPTAFSTNGWRDLPPNSLVSRVWRPHRRAYQAADSPARACRTLLRELELINRHIQAQYLSRLASAGVVLFPEEVQMPVRPEFADLPDPFVSEWVQVASEAINTPGSAASIVPIPIKVPGEWLDKIKHVDFTLKLDDQIIVKRNSALTRLAISLDMPPEALLGTKDVNHWNAWLIDEQGVKIHVAPDAEIICSALTLGYLWPRLKAAGVENPEQWVVWYDASELILRPDRSTAALNVYDRGEINGTALRRENGFDEADKPTDEELRRMLLIYQARQPLNAFQSLTDLGLETEHDPGLPLAPDTTRPAPESPGEETPPEQRGPAQERNGPPATVDRREALIAKLAHQANLMHAIRVALDGWTVLHPAECAELLRACPVSHATWKSEVSALPGMRGTYRLFLNSYGVPILGQTLYNGDTEGWLESPKHPSTLSQPVG
jgi:hypothetical protein